MSHFVLSRPVLFVRSMLFLAGFALYTTLISLPIIFSFGLPLRWRYSFFRLHPQGGLWWLKVTCGLSYRIEGKENLPEDPSVIFSKHQSTWETFALAASLPPATYVAKRELLWIPFFGWGMAALRFITIDRSAGRKAIQQIVQQAHKRLADGLWIIIFPEGTRGLVGAKTRYKVGGAVMASEIGAKVVPVAVNSGQFWPRDSWLKWPGEITMSIGPAIDTVGKTPEQISDAAKTWIEDKMPQILLADPASGRKSAAE